MMEFICLLPQHTASATDWFIEHLPHFKLEPSIEQNEKKESMKWEK